MTVSTLRPSGTSSNTGAVTGAGSAHAALSDNSDSSYVDFDNFETWIGTVGDLTLPTGAMLKNIALRARVAAAAGTPRGSASFPTTDTHPVIGSPFITWGAPTTITFAVGTPDVFTDSAIDAGALSLLSGPSAGATARFYEAYVDVTYVEKPTLVVDLPTGTVTDTNQPTISWTATLDADGGPQTYWRVLVFTDAQYLAGGFDPGTTTPTADSGGGVQSVATSWQPTTVLPDDTYRAYVQVSQTVNGVVHLSEYAFVEFTVAVVPPGTPTIIATADNSNARIALAVTDNPGTASTDTFEVQASADGGATWETVRTVDPSGEIGVPWVAAVGEFTSVADATSHALVLPAPTGGIRADDLLLAFVAMDGNPTLAWPTGWAEIKDEAGNGSAVRAGVAWKRATGGESGTITLTTGASEGGGARILCVRDAHPTTAPEVSAGVSSSAANANPDSLNPTNWGTENTLWIAAMALDGNVAITAGPSSYYEFGNTRWANAGGASLATASRVALAASEDPGAFTHTLEDSRAFTVGVRPRNANLTVYDYEAANGTLMTYRARALHDYSGVRAASAWSTSTATWASTQWWLKHPNRPDLNAAVTVRGLPNRARAGRQGVFQALGSSVAVVVSDARGAPTGQVTLRSLTLAEQADLDALLDTTDTLLLQGPAGTGDPGYVRVGNHDRQRIVDVQDAARQWEALDYTVVAPPPGEVDAWP